MYIHSGFLILFVSSLNLTLCYFRKKNLLDMLVKTSFFFFKRKICLLTSPNIGKSQIAPRTVDVQKSDRQFPGMAISEQMSTWDLPEESS